MLFSLSAFERMQTLMRVASSSAITPVLSSLLSRGNMVQQVVLLAESKMMEQRTENFGCPYNEAYTAPMSLVAKRRRFRS